jgi:hypothetical protein
MNCEQLNVTPLQFRIVQRLFLLTILSSEKLLHSSTRYNHENEKQKKTTELGRKIEIMGLFSMV